MQTPDDLRRPLWPPSHIELTYTHRHGLDSAELPDP